MLLDRLHENYLRVILLVAVVLSFFYNIYGVPLFDLDEGAFSEATREMFERGDFVSTYLNGEPRYDKPILIYWLQATSVSVFGLNEFALRLPSALAGTAWVLLVYGFSRRIAPTNAGLLAALVVATAFEVSVMAKAATADALLNLFVAASMLGAFLYWRERRLSYLYFTFAAMGLGFLTKGPIAVLIPGVVTCLFFVLRGEWRFWLRTVFHPGGIALFLVIAAPWYVVQYLKEGDGFIQGFFFKHNVGRFQGAMEGHGGSYFYYVPVLFLAVVPYTAVLVALFGRWRERLRDEFTLYAWLWFAVVFVLFTLSSTKLPHYLLYGLTGLFVLLGQELERARGNAWWYLPQLAFFAALVLLPEILAAWLPGVKSIYQREAFANYTEFFSTGYYLFFAAAVLFSAYCMLEKRVHHAYKLTFSAVLVVFSVSAYLLPFVGSVYQEPVREAALFAKRAQYPVVVMWHVDVPSFSVYREHVTERRKPLPGEVVLTKVSYLHEIGPHTELYRRQGFVLARLADLTP